ncbi:MAG: hypothetical protein ACR2JB_04060 [Bryobacteraceae bacterium]
MKHSHITKPTTAAPVDAAVPVFTSVTTNVYLVLIVNKKELRCGVVLFYRRTPDGVV